jgi:hypothetical protein
MTQKFTHKNIPIFLVFVFIQGILIYLAIIVFLNPGIILKDKEAFCGILLFVSALLLFLNIIQTYIITNCIINYLTTQNQSQNTKNKKLSEKENFKNIGLSILQISFGLSFSILGISLVTLIFFKKIDDKKISLLGKIYCGIFAICTISMITLSILSTIIVYFYSKNLIKKNTKLEEIKENKILKICNFCHNIENFLCSINLYTCHLFINEKYQANKIHFHKKEKTIHLTRNEQHQGIKCSINDSTKSIITETWEIQSKIIFCTNFIQFSIRFKNQNYQIQIYISNDEQNNFDKLNNIEEKNNFIKELFTDANLKNIEIYEYNNPNYQNNEITHSHKITFNSLGLFIPQLTLEIT